MSAALSNFVVVIAIAVSACYCVWRLGPRRVRDAMRMRLHKVFPGLFGQPGRMAPGSGCDACGGCQAPTRNASRSDNTFVLKRR